MATRWKKEPCETLLLMHAHNQWSFYNDSLLTAAYNLNIPVAERSYPNCSGDGSWDHEYYMLSSAVERAGGIDAVHLLAQQLQEEVYGEELNNRYMW